MNMVHKFMYIDMLPNYNSMLADIATESPHSSQPRTVLPTASFDGDSDFYADGESSPGSGCSGPDDSQSDSGSVQSWSSNEESSDEPDNVQLLEENSTHVLQYVE